MKIQIVCGFCGRGFICEPSSAGVPPHTCSFTIAPKMVSNDGVIEYGIGGPVSNAQTVEAKP